VESGQSACIPLRGRSWVLRPAVMRSFRHFDLDTSTL
jgi:hypothetical protein